MNSAIRRLTPQDFQALADFRAAIAAFLDFSARAAQAVGLEPRQHQALLAIKGGHGPGAVTVGHLADRLKLRPNSAVGLVDRLCKRGLLRRVPDRRDHRVVHLQLTPAGQTIIRRLSAVHHAELQERGPELQQRLSALMR